MRLPTLCTAQVLAGLAICILNATPCQAGEVFQLSSGASQSGDVVWVTSTSLELMETGSDSVTSVPLSQLAPLSRYRALRLRRHLTGGQPGALELARQARSWGLLEAARAELDRAALEGASEAAVNAERRALSETETRLALDRAREALAANRLVTAGQLLERIAAAGTSSSGAARQVLDQHRAGIDEARKALAARQAALREAKRRERLMRTANSAIASSAEIMRVADQIRLATVEEHWPISRARWTLLDAAQVLVAAGNDLDAALAGLPDDDESREALEAHYLANNAKLADVYADLADLYLIRSNLLEAYEWATIALILVPDHERARQIRRIARLGGAISGGGHGPWLGRGRISDHVLDLPTVQPAPVFPAQPTAPSQEGGSVPDSSDVPSTGPAR